MELEFFALNVGTAAGSVINNGVWASFVGFLSDILRSINTVTGNFGLSVIIFTILMRGLLLPLDMKSRNSMKKVAEIQPKLKQINEKYKNDAEKRNKKTMELYQEHKISPVGGCLPMLLQMPLLFAMFAALQRIASYELGLFLIEFLEQSPVVATAFEQVTAAVANSNEIRDSMVNIIRQIFANPQARIVQNLTEVAGAENVSIIVEAVKNTSNADVMRFLQDPKYDSFRFLWIRNIWVADSPLMTVSGAPAGGLLSPFRNGFFILPILSAASAYYLTKLTPSAGGQQATQMKSMAAVMPLMSLWFTATANAGFALYWVINNVFQITYFLVNNRTNSLKKEGTIK